MIRSTVFVFLVSFLIPAYSSPSNLGIVGGNKTDIEVVPYQASVYMENLRKVCGGSILSDTWVITAAHCTNLTSDTEISVRVGSSNYDQGGQSIKASQVFHRDDFDPFNDENDIALIKLSGKIIFSKKAQPIQLMNATEVVKNGTGALISGWGTKKEGDEYQVDLQSLRVPILSRDQCREKYKDNGLITKKMICAGPLNADGFGICYGDDGGPLVVEGKLLGLALWEARCGKAAFPGIFADLRTHRDFISKITGL